MAGMASAHLVAAGFKYRDGALPNLLVLAYIAAGWPGGVALLLSSSWTANGLGVVLVAHTLAISTYLLHECIHDTIFAAPAHNARLGTLLAWLNGGCYAGFDQLRKKHLHHHFDRMDPISWDFRAFLAGLPRPARGVLLGLEWLHFPALELVLRGECLLRPFRVAGWRRERARMVATFGLRVGLFLTLAAVSPRAAALYLVGWLVFLIGLRFLDAFHHTFELVTLPDYDTRFPLPPAWDRAYELERTFSNVLSVRHPVLNLLVINFCFHNAHHAKPGIPWHRLPSLDRRLFGGPDGQWRPVWRLLGDFHRYRVRRVLASTAPEQPFVNIGAVGVSLLTP